MSRIFPFGKSEKRRDKNYSFIMAQKCHKKIKNQKGKEYVIKN
jgi:hypothetical protein